MDKTLATLRPALEALLNSADAIWRSGNTSRWADGLGKCDRALALLQSFGRSPEATDWAARAHFVRGHLLEAQGTMDSIVQAMRAYEQAITLWRALPASHATTPELAAAWMNRGNTLQKLGSPAALAEAVRSYDQTIGLLGDLPPDAPESHRLMAGAAWMNRGCSQHQINSETERTEALRSLDQAITLLEPFVGSHEAGRRNFIYALTNRGLMLLQKGDAAAAILAQEKALSVLGETSGTSPGTTVERAGIKLHLGQAHWAAKNTEAATTMMTEVLSDLAELETADWRAVDTGLRTRHALCVILGANLTKEPPGSASRSTLVSQASDLVEDGLSLAGQWGPDIPWARDAAARLFEFGAWLYRTHQRHFLAEFLQEYLHEADADSVRIARSAIAQARQEIIQGSFATLLGAQLEQVTETLRIFNAIESRLQAAGE